jgi:hypothetical protein
MSFPEPVPLPPEEFRVIRRVPKKSKMGVWDLALLFFVLALIGYQVAYTIIAGRASAARPVYQSIEPRSWNESRPPFVVPSTTDMVRKRI